MHDTAQVIVNQIGVLQVRVSCATSGQAAHFPADRWLRWDQATGADGCRLELLPGQPPPGGLVSYEVRVATSDLRGAGTDADVSITLFGDRGDSGPLALASSANDFERGRTDTFFVKVSCRGRCKGESFGAPRIPPVLQLAKGGCRRFTWHACLLQALDVGAISAARVACSGSGHSASWHLASITVTNTGSGQVAVFHHNSWLDQEHGWEQMLHMARRAADGAGAHEPELASYRVTVYTSDLPDAATNARVFLELRGSAGIAGEQQLQRQGATGSSSSRRLFARSQCDRFLLRASDVGQLQQVVVRLEADGAADAWHLRLIEVQRCSDSASGIIGAQPAPVSSSTVPDHGADEEQPDQRQRNSASSSEQAAAALVRTLFYHGDWVRCGAESRVVLQALCASAADSSTSSGCGPARVRYMVEVATSDLPGAGTDAKVFLQVRAAGGAPSSCNLLGASNNQAPSLGLLPRLTTCCACNPLAGARPARPAGWLGAAPGQLEQRLRDRQHQHLLPGPARRAGLRRAALQGAGGCLAPCFCRTASRSYPSGSALCMNTLHLPAQISREASWLPGSDWHLASLTITDLVSGGSYSWSCSQWLDRQHGLSRAWDAAQAAAGQPQGLQLLWGPPALLQQLQQAGEQAQQQEQEADRQFKLSVLTSDKLGAGTGAKVCLQFIDTEGRTWSPQLAQTPEHFQKGSRDHLLLSCTQPLGQVASARVWLEGGGASAFWHLQELRLTDLRSYAAWRFPADDWVPCSLAPDAALLLQAQPLSAGAGAGPGRATSARSTAASQSQLLARVSVGQLPPALLQSRRRTATRTTSSVTGAPVDLELTVVTGDRFGAGTDAAVYVAVLGPGGVVAASEALPRAPGLFERKGQWEAVLTRLLHSVALHVPAG
jgi:hypothetical protein